MADGGIEVDLVIEDDRWTAMMPDAEKQAALAIDSAYGEAGFDGPASLCLLLADDARLHALNRDFRGKDKPTNVLSFPMEGEVPPGAVRTLGDIAVAYETVEREADEAHRPFLNHTLHLIVHGSLHLIGYTHEDAQEAERMESLEISALARLGIPTPYEVPPGVQT